MADTHHWVHSEDSDSDSSWVSGRTTPPTTDSATNDEPASLASSLTSLAASQTSSTTSRDVVVAAASRSDQLRDVIVEGVTLTSDPNQVDMISLDCCEPVRAVMPCSHVIGAQSLYDYCINLLSRGKCQLVCASCSAVWSYSVVRAVACLSHDESRHFEQMLSDNTLRVMQGHQRCAGCSSWYTRSDTNNNMVHCVVCSELHQRTVYYCWLCLHEWQGGLSSDGCGNAVCASSSGRHRGQEQLLSCVEREIGGIMTPTVRACPNCLSLIEHTVQLCSQITCKLCGYEFCFICLKRYAGFAQPSTSVVCASAGRGTCAGSAPRQQLPVHDVTPAAPVAPATAAPDTPDIRPVLRDNGRGQQSQLESTGQHREVATRRLHTAAHSSPAKHRLGDRHSLQSASRPPVTSAGRLPTSMHSMHSRSSVCQPVTDQPNMTSSDQPNVTSSATEHEPTRLLSYRAGVGLMSRARPAPPTAPATNPVAVSDQSAVTTSVAPSLPVVSSTQSHKPQPRPRPRSAQITSRLSAVGEQQSQAPRQQDKLMTELTARLAAQSTRRSAHTQHTSHDDST